MPAPNRRNHGATVKVNDHTGASQVTDRRDRFKASQTRAASRWEQVAADLHTATGSDLAERAEQARTDYERARQFEHFEAEVRTGRAKPPIIVLDREARRERMKVEATQRASSAAFRRVLDTACPGHAAKPGEPCWWPLDHAAVCGDRIRRAGFVGEPSARATYTRSGR